MTEKKTAANHLSRAIRFKTISHQDTSKVDSEKFKLFHGFLQEIYPLIYEHLKREAVNDLSLLFTWEGSDPKLKPIVLTAHIDVVPVAPETLEDWEQPPFDGNIADGYLWGRGTMDCKGFLISIMEAVEGLLAEGFKPQRTVYLAFGHDEEVSGYQGACRIAELMKSRGISAELVLDEGGYIVHSEALGVKKPLASIGIAEKGYLTLRLIVEAEGGHSSMPPRHSAIGILASAIHRLEKNPFPARFHEVLKLTINHLRPAMPFLLRFVLKNLWLFGGLVKRVLSKIAVMNAMLRTTIATTIIKAGTKENVLPQKAQATVNFRLLPGDTSDYVISRVKKKINDPRVSIEILGKPTEASSISDMNSNGFNVFLHTLKENLPDVLMAPSLVVGMTDARHYAQISDSVFRFGPLRVAEEDQKRAHGTNERIDLDNFKECIKFYTQLIKNSVR